MYDRKDHYGNRYEVKEKLFLEGFMMCTKCKKVQPISEFYKLKKTLTGLQSHCKECGRKYESDNRDKGRERSRRSYRKKPAEHRYQWLKLRAIKKTIPICNKDEFITWFYRQERVCVYCGMTEERAKELYHKALHVDRIDSSGGYIVTNMKLACDRCNRVKTDILTFEQMEIVAQMFFNKEDGDANR